VTRQEMRFWAACAAMAGHLADPTRRYEEEEIIEESARMADALLTRLDRAAAEPQAQGGEG
jgi:hypothetical protein